MIYHLPALWKFSACSNELNKVLRIVSDGDFEDDSVEDSEEDSESEGYYDDHELARRASSPDQEFGYDDCRMAAKEKISTL
jgi:hypothetical protein